MTGPRDFLPSSRPLELLLAAVVAATLVVDIAVLAPKPAGDVATLLRIALAGGAVGAVVIALACGVVVDSRYAVGAVLAAPVVALYAYTGLLLPWGQFSFYLGQVGLETLLSIPVVGEWLANWLFGGWTLTAASLQRAFQYHYAIVAAGVVVGGLVVSSAVGDS